MNTQQEISIRDEFYKEENRVNNYRQIRVKWYPMTNKRNARIKIYEPSRFSGDAKHKDKMQVWLTSEMNATIQAWDYLRKKGFNIVGRANDQNETIFFCDNWAKDFIEVNGETTRNY
tara:strand:+ start:5127 stop:5477 length:351 start_codon:yes stop_codon:yes gene_type:complete